jgi:hypothetical protein
VSWLVVDAMNVIGSRPDGWWHDRRGAIDDLVASLRAAASRLDADRVTVVADGRGDDQPADASGVELVWAGRGRDAADDRIVALLEGTGTPATVVTADRRLRERVRACGAQVIGPGALRRDLDVAGADRPEDD